MKSEIFNPIIKVCCECGHTDDIYDYFKFDGKVYCESCIQKKLRIEPQTIYYCQSDGEYYEDLATAFEENGAEKL